MSYNIPMKLLDWIDKNKLVSEVIENKKTNKKLKD